MLTHRSLNALSFYEAIRNSRAALQHYEVFLAFGPPSFPLTTTLSLSPTEIRKDGGVDGRLVIVTTFHAGRVTQRDSLGSPRLLIPF